MSEDLKARVQLLEYRLARYHEHLEDALDHDRKFQLKATWGIVNSAIGGVALFAVLYASKNWLGLSGFFPELLSGFVAFAAWGAATAWSDRGREGDLNKLSRLPRWEERCD